MRQKVTVSAQPAKQQPSSAQRRAAQIAAVSGKQADLKREATERREKRALTGDAAAPAPRKATAARRYKPR